MSQPGQYDLASLQQLLEIMAKLRDPDGGCPWDLKQTFATIAPYTIEEAYEVEDAIARNDMPALQDELGDLLLQVVFHARMAEEAGHFAFPDVATSIAEKMVRRHPHVFGSVEADHPEAVSTNWEAIKAAERAAKPAAVDVSTVLAGVTTGLPALTRAVKLQNRAARVGFDWPDKKPVLAKIREELEELEQEISAGASEAIAEEFGDFLFVVANLARHLKLDPEQCLRNANRKFERRFSMMEQIVEESGRNLTDCDLTAMDEAWDKAKALERKAG
ncbi:MAG TPA: nucleoside triphosphate pyrophosphohydrolase [Ferrovibrio sp.]|jgi:ATP diphosphatase|uniref:nucleoside triphosphate pyrophosphohydrolase n=1 Tax=Ferrovibrio sp. TaxID=1917215 RepID=UPI002B4ABE19|nr:nucleoside triphosphate pyrophosphohydrolase [Ferrovibrio sp.]HLT77211.1 nucleoside triphosphate pyrophosphohydrolase [Ferrovibrio sp.]